MSRSNVAKSRAEKGKLPNAPTPAVAHEIVPGKYNDQDWNASLEHDEGDEYVYDIMEDVCGAALDIIYDKYLEKQLVPFTVLQAKDALLQIVEWQFLSRDEGEASCESDEGWIQDEEPEASVTDCWAQGAVSRQVMPLTGRTPPPLPSVEEEQLQQVTADGEEVEETEESLNTQQAQLAEESESAVQADSEGTEKQSTEMVTVASGGTFVVQPQEPVVTEQEVPVSPPQTTKESSRKASKRRKKYRPYNGKLGSAGLSKMTHSLDMSELELYMSELPHYVCSPAPTAQLQMPTAHHSMLKLQAGRPPGNRDVIFDDGGNISTMSRIPPSRLPSHRVKTNFQIVDPDVEAAQARLEAMRTGRYLKNSAKYPPKPPSKASYTGNSRKGAAATDQIGPLPPPLLECMEVSPGVVVREGERTKRGYRQHAKAGSEAIGTTKYMSTGPGLSSRGTGSLRPVAINAPLATINVSQLLEQQAPVIRPLQQTPPIPPIMPHPTQLLSQ